MQEIDGRLLNGIATPKLKKARSEFLATARERLRTPTPENDEYPEMLT